MTLVRCNPGTMRRWAPNTGVANWANGWDSLFDEFFGHSPAMHSDWAPALDVREEEKHYVVQVDLPGTSKDDIKITFENDILTITGERKSEHKEQSAKMHRSERFVGKFTRSLRFPTDVDPAKIEAEFKDGVLHVKLEKSESAMVRQIEVK